MPLVRKTVGAAAPAPTSDGRKLAATLREGTDDERWAAARGAAEIARRALAAGRRTRAGARAAGPRGDLHQPGAHRARWKRGRRTAASALGRCGPAHRCARRAAGDAGGAAGGHLPLLLADADADVRLLACELARSLPADEASRAAWSSCSSGRQNANVCAAAVEVLAEIGGPSLPALARCAARFPDDPFLAFAIKAASDRIGSRVTRWLIRRRHERGIPQACEFLYRRTGMVFTEAKRYYVERRIAERMAATASRSFADYFAHLRSEGRRRGRAVHQRLHRQRDLLLPRRPPARLPDDGSARRARARRSGPARRSASGRCRARPARSPIRSRCGCWRTGRRSTPTTSRSSDRTSIPDVLEAAAEGIFGKRALMRLSPELIARYFHELDDERWQILDDLRQSVRFSRVNLVDTARPGRKAGSTSSSAETC